MEFVHFHGTSVWGSLPPLVLFPAGPRAADEPGPPHVRPERFLDRLPTFRKDHFVAEPPDAEVPPVDDRIAEVRERVVRHETQEAPRARDAPHAIAISVDYAQDVP